MPKKYPVPKVQSNIGRKRGFNEMIQSNNGGVSADGYSNHKHEKTPTTHNEHKIAAERTADFENNYVTIEDEASRMFSMKLPGELERANVQLISEFCTKNKSNCRSRCQFGRCGGCVHMFKCSCWKGAVNGGILCRHCHAVLPWARTFLEISSQTKNSNKNNKNKKNQSTYLDGGIRAEDVMLGISVREEGSDIVVSMDDDLTPPSSVMDSTTNDDDRRNEETTVPIITIEDEPEIEELQQCSTKITVPEPSCFSITRPITNTIPPSPPLRSSSSLSSSSSSNPNKNTLPTSHNPDLSHPHSVPQNLTTVEVSSSRRETTVSDTTLDECCASTSDYSSDFHKAGQNLVQCIQDEFLKELPMEVKNELCEHFNDLVLLIRNCILQEKLRQRRDRFPAIRQSCRTTTHPSNNKSSQIHAEPNFCTTNETDTTNGSDRSLPSNSDTVTATVDQGSNNKADSNNDNSNISNNNISNNSNNSSNSSSRSRAEAAVTREARIVQRLRDSANLGLAKVIGRVDNGTVVLLRRPLLATSPLDNRNDPINLPVLQPERPVPSTSSAPTPLRQPPSSQRLFRSNVLRNNRFNDYRPRPLTIGFNSRSTRFCRLSDNRIIENGRYRRVNAKCNGRTAVARETTSRLSTKQLRPEPEPISSVMKAADSLDNKEAVPC